MRTLAQLQLKQSDEARERVEGAFDMSGLGEAEGTAGDAASQEEDAGEDQDEPEEAPGGSGAAVAIGGGGGGSPPGKGGRQTQSKQRGPSAPRV
jgi:hypothetical protein